MPARMSDEAAELLRAFSKLASTSREVANALRDTNQAAKGYVARQQIVAVPNPVPGYNPVSDQVLDLPSPASSLWLRDERQPIPPNYRRQLARDFADLIGGWVSNRTLGRLEKRDQSFKLVWIRNVVASETLEKRIRERLGIQPDETLEPRLASRIRPNAQEAVRRAYQNGVWQNDVFMTELAKRLEEIVNPASNRPVENNTTNPVDPAVEVPAEVEEADPDDPVTLQKRAIRLLLAEFLIDAERPLEAASRISDNAVDAYYLRRESEGVEADKQRDWLFTASGTDAAKLMAFVTNYLEVAKGLTLAKTKEAVLTIFGWCKTYVAYGFLTADTRLEPEIEAAILRDEFKKALA